MWLPASQDDGEEDNLSGDLEYYEGVDAYEGELPDELDISEEDF